MKKNVVIIIFCTMCRSLAWPRRCLPVWRDVAVRDILVRPYGLRVRSRRTMSPKASDCRFSAFKLDGWSYGMIAMCRNDFSMMRARKIDAFENVPPLVPSQASKADVQRDEGTGVTSILPPVSLPFSNLVTHLIIFMAKFEQK